MKLLPTLYLSALPIGLMGSVQLCFAVLSNHLYKDHAEYAFSLPGLTMVFGAALVLLCFHSKHREASNIGYREALLFATLVWLLMGLLGAIPIMYIADISFTDAVFEAISGLTTTGATVLSGLDSMPKTFLMYRQFLQWLGGLGVVIFVVAVLPMLNVGGMKLLKAETPGPIKNDKLAPRVSSSAHYLWLVYLSLTLACAASYFLCGMSAFDSIAHSFTTVSTGGFSTHDSSMGYFDSHLMLFVCNIFMLLGAINFALHFRAWRLRALSEFFLDEECKVFLIIVACLSLLLAAMLLANATYTNPLVSLSQATFHLISFITSTGFGADNFTGWPLPVIFILIVAGYLGGCAGSTAGGNKIIRNIIMFKMIRHELRRLIHPAGVFTLRYQKRPIEVAVISATMAFITLATLTTAVATLLLMWTGLGLLEALSAAAACVNVLGPAFGELGSNFQPVSDQGMWILSFTMILGRLEYFTVLSILLPAFWKG